MEKIIDYIKETLLIKKLESKLESFNKKSTGEMIYKSMDEKSLANTIGIFGPGTYHYLSYGILFSL